MSKSDKYILCRNFRDLLLKHNGRLTMTDDEIIEDVIGFYRLYNSGTVSRNMFAGAIRELDINKRLDEEFEDLSRINRTVRTECILRGRP